MEAAEEAELGTGGTTKAKKALNAASKKKKGQKKDDLSMLEDALQKSADKMVKKKKAEELAKKEKEQAAAMAKKAAEASAAPVDPLLSNTDEMIGGVDDEIGRAANKARMAAAETSGIDAALGSLKVAGNVVTSPKALYAEFEARMLPIVKADHPGLRLSQYKEKVFALWKKSPDNPANQQPRAS